MSFFQRLFRRVTPAATFAKMEADSRLWVMRCPCGHETSIWEMGGIRYKAYGRPYTMGRCARCGKKFMGRLYRKGEL